MFLPNLGAPQKQKELVLSILGSGPQIFELGLFGFSLKPLNRSTTFQNWSTDFVWQLSYPRIIHQSSVTGHSRLSASPALVTSNVTDGPGSEGRCLGRVSTAMLVITYNNTRALLMSCLEIAICCYHVFV
jgi:hypothetical protein